MGWYRRIFVGSASGPSTYFLSRWLFLRGLGIVYLLVFLSFSVQLEGLIGSNGILPAAAYMDAIWDKLGVVGVWTFPTLCWISADDVFLRLLCNGGVVLSICLILGLLPVPSLIGLWALYLSLSTVSRTFLGYQWDTFILEVGLLAILLAPGQIITSLSRAPQPSRLAVWMCHWLLFRLMLSAGLVKLTSGDMTWRDLTALDYHYWTQPIPNPLAWYAHQLPQWFQKVSVAGTLVIETIIPFAIFGPRRVRFVACAATVLLMSVIAATGNYCFFNILAIVLCVLLLDDHFLRCFLPRRWRNLPDRPRRHSATNHICVVVAAVVIIPLSLIQMKPRVFHLNLTDVEQRIYRWTAPYRSVNGYGLFANMTTSRPEIVVEGSNNRKDWKVYEFKWKPGALDRRPPQVAPHQPRIDWQMWFEALNWQRGGKPKEWFRSFIVRLLEGTPEVLDLLAHNPFPEEPPKYIRAVVYDYEFTSEAEYAETGNWWRRTHRGVYVYPSNLPDKK